MTFATILTAVYRRVKLTDTPSTADVTRIKEFVNQWHRRILALPGMDQLRDTSVTFTTVVNQQKYGLPYALTKVRDIYDLTNQRRVMPRTLDWLRNVDPGLTATSSFTENWIPLNGWGAQITQPAQTGVTLSVFSDNVADAGQTISIDTLNIGTTGGPVLMAGQTANLAAPSVHVGIGTTGVIEIVKAYIKSGSVQGNVSIIDGSSNVLSVIPSGQTSARYYQIQLYPTPGAATVLTVDCQRSIVDLHDDNEEPLLPTDFHQVLVHLGAYEEFVNRNDDRASLEYNPDPRATKKGHANVLLEALRHYVLTSPDQIPVQRGPRAHPQRISRLGGWFPANT